MIAAAQSGHDQDELQRQAGLITEGGAETQAKVPDGKAAIALYRQLSTGAMVAYNANSIRDLFQALSELHALRPPATEEALSGYFDSYLAYVSLLAGRACADRYAIDQAYSICERVHSLLVAKRNRQRVHGTQLHADAQVWYSMLNLIAELKWKGEKEFIDRLMTPREIVDEYRLVVRRVVSQMRDPSIANQNQKQITIDAVKWCGIQVIKMIYRWEPDSADEYIQEYNKTFDSALSCDLGNFLYGRPKQVGDPRYWDFEFFKICQSPEFDESEFLYCFQWRLDAVRAGRRDEAALRSFRLATELELQRMAQIKLA